MEIGRFLKEGVGYFIKDIVVLIIAGLVVTVGTIVTLGIIAGPLQAGYYMMIINRIRDGKPPEFFDQFLYMNRFGELLIVFYSLAILCLIGFSLLIIPGLYLATIWIYAFPLVVEKKLPLGQAMSKSKEIVSQHGLGAHFVFIILLSLIHLAVTKLTGGLGSVVTMPYVTCAVCSAYIAFIKSNHELEHNGLSYHPDGYNDQDGREW